MNVDLIFATAFSVILIALVVAVVMLIKNNKLSVIREHCYQLFIIAENIYGANKGAEKFAYVCNYVYDLFPAWLQYMVDRETTNKLVQKWFDEVISLTKDYLDNGIIDHSTEQKQ